MRFLKPIFLIFVAFLILGIPAASQAQVAVGISVHVGPPVLPIYEQPAIPAPGYIWTPGYWAYGPAGYYWVPGVWVEPPSVGLLWTPGYWGWGGGVYMWHGGYWGPHVGFYGGINYGYGYTGVGFAGGYWRGGAFYYNRAYANVGTNTTIVHNTYNTTVVNNNTTVNRTAYNGGPGGVAAKPTTAELTAARENHVQPTALQTQHQQAASTNRAMLASTNHGQPSVAATSKPGVFKGAGVVSAHPVSAAQTPAITGAVKGSASGFNSQANAHTSSQAQVNPNAAKTTQPTYGAQSSKAAKATQPTYGAQSSNAAKATQPTYGAQSSKAAKTTQPTYGGQNATHTPSGVQPQAHPQQQHQAQPQEHQPAKSQGEQHEGKPHKPRG